MQIRNHELNTSLPDTLPELTKKGYLFKPAGPILRNAGLLLLLAILVLAAWFNQAMIVILIGLALITAVLAKLWSRYSLVGVHCRRFLSERRIFPGEEVEFTLTLVNRKPLPLPWIRVDDKIPDDLVIKKQRRIQKAKNGFLTNTASLMWYESMKWRYYLKCSKRGYYPIGPLVMSSGDIFGFYPRTQTEDANDHIIVYPKLYPLATLDLPSRYPLGEIQAKQRIFEDPTRTIGVRDYSPSDSLRFIHWKASARHQKLQVKIFEPTTTLNVIIFLAIDSFLNDGDSAADIFELGMSTAASITKYVIEQRCPVGLYMNTPLIDTQQLVKIKPGRGPSQLIQILEGLAKVNNVASGSFAEFFHNERKSFPWGTTLILIISQIPESFRELLINLRRAGHRPVVFQIGSDLKNNTQQPAEWYQISNANDLINAGSEGNR
jgi:uncharacterized protein (DUF58 family)